MIGSSCRQAASEGSLLLKVAVNLDFERSRMVGKGRGEHKRVSKGSGGGSRSLLESNQEGMSRRDFGAAGGGVRVVCGGEEED